ncbi:MAG TPA: DEAD/DEAH box helicase, partial [Candidatus Bathyarchaeia archaeon]
MQTFRDLPLKTEVLKGIEELGFEELFPIQAQAICPLLEGKDVIGQAQTGTGKTAAFGVPMVERLTPEIRKVQG